VIPLAAIRDWWKSWKAVRGKEKKGKKINKMNTWRTKEIIGGRVWKKMKEGGKVRLMGLGIIRIMQ
jgi:hypothetical protein